MKIHRVNEVPAADKHRLFGWGEDIFQDAQFGLQWRRKDVHVLVEENGQVVGHVGILARQPVEMGGEKFFVGGIGGVVTVPDARGKGFAREGLRAAEEILLAEPDVDFAMLFCREPLIGFYQKWGWQRVMSSVSAKNSSGKCIVNSSSKCAANFFLPPIISIISDGACGT